MFIGEMFDPFSKVYKQLNVKPDAVCTDNWIYLLHRKWSFIFSFVSLSIMAAYTVILDPTHMIVCFGPNEREVPGDFLKDWCYLSGTYINPEYLNKKIGKEVPHPGIGPDTPNMDKVYHSHYMFYPVIFLVQFSLFRASKYIWKHMEGGRLKSLLSELTSAVNTTDEVRKRIERVADYMIHSPLTFHSSYSYRFILCELFNAFNIIFQFGMIDFVLHHEFLNFGWDSVGYIRSSKFANSTHVDPFTKVFPKMAKCLMPKHGPSGNVVWHEALCVLPWNNVAEKFFFFWWFWLSLLGVLTVFGLMYRAIVLFSPCARYFILRLRTRGTGCDSVQLRAFCDRQKYGDWFVLSLVQKNLDPWIFAQLMGELDMQRVEGRRRKEH